MEPRNYGSTSKGQAWTGRILSTLAVLFLLFDSITKLMRSPAVMQGTMQLGYPAAAILPMGVILLACTTLYVVPRTAVFGAVLLTGYLGGAVASNVRISNPLFSHTLFPVYFAVLVWAGLLLRDQQLRRIFPVRRFDV